MVFDGENHRVRTGDERVLVYDGDDVPTFDLGGQGVPMVDDRLTILPVPTIH